MYKSIVVPLDGSEFSKAALAHAVELAKAFQARLTLLYVVEPAARYYYGTTDMYALSAIEESAAQEERREYETAEQFLEQTKYAVASEGVEVECHVLEGDPGSRICDYASANNADLIVMSTHGRTGLQRWVYGSVAEKVLRGAGVPVLLVRAHPLPTNEP